MELKPCPFCGGQSRWCDCGSPCHIIECTQCEASIDMAGNDNPETVEELQRICVDRYNNRVNVYGEPHPDIPTYKIPKD